MTPFVTFFVHAPGAESVSHGSLETASKDGFVRITVEVLLAFALVTVTYVLVVEPLLQSVAPDVYVQAGLDYSRTNLPDTATEVTHLVLSVALVGSFFY